MRPLHFFVGLFAVGVAACSSPDEPPYQPCVPGQASACSCPDGSPGHQSCDDSGDRYGACKCASGDGGSASSTNTTGGGSPASTGTGASTATSSTTSTGGAATSSTGAGAATGSGGAIVGTGGGDGAPLDAEWADALGTTDARISSVAFDSAGDLLVAGLYQGDLTFGATTFTCSSTGDFSCAFVLKLTGAGDLVWSKAFTGTANEGVENVRLAVGPSDEVVVAGAFLGSVDFSPDLADGTPSVFVRSYDDAGDLRWAQTYDAMGSPITVTGLAVDLLGRAVMSGYAPPGLDFGAGARMGLYHVQFDSMGNVTWARGFDGPGPGVAPGGSSVAVTPTGDVISVGFQGGGQIPQGCSGLTGATDAFVIELDGGTGACNFGRELGTVPVGAPLVVACDPSDGGMFVAGDLSGSVDAGTTTLTPVGSSSAFLLRMDSTAQPLWGVVLGDTGEDDAFAVAINPVTHEVAVTGDTLGDIDFGAGPLAGPGQVFLGAYTSDGVLVAGERYGDGNQAMGDALAFSPDGASLAIGGSFLGAISFGPSLSFQSGTARNAFVADLVSPEPPGCTGDLSNIGTGDFHVSFDVATSQPDAQIAIVNQRSVCSHDFFWDVHFGVGGVVEVETDHDGADYTALLGTRAVNDGATHHVEVARVAGSLTLTIDGVLDGSAASAASLDALAPLAVRTDVCDGVNGSVPLVGALTNLCVTSP